MSRALELPSAVILINIIRAWTLAMEVLSVQDKRRALRGVGHGSNCIYAWEAKTSNSANCLPGYCLQPLQKEG
ncbi:hypothetical protein COP2_003953 [Malus domestica]